MERLTEKFKDGRNILRKGISDVFHVGFGRFFDGEAVDRLAEYEDLEEQGEMLKLPCAVGDTVYRLEAIQALEKQIPKKPRTHQDTNRADCPVCGATVRGIKEPFGDWCSKCGQKLDWE